MVAGLMAMGICTKSHGQGASSSNPLEYAAIQKGEADINSHITTQTRYMGELAAVQGTMVGEATLMKKWEKQYNSYLTTTKGYAEKIAAACTLFQEGVQTLTYLWEIDQARKVNPQGVFASMSMNNLYMEIAAEFTKTYRLLNKVVKKGGQENMLNGSERTLLLWKLSAELEQLNKKLRSLALSITVFNFEDVWNRAIAGKIEKTNGMLAEDARKRQSKAMRQVAKFYQVRQNSKPWFK